MGHASLPDNTPIIVGAGQCVERLEGTEVDQLASPMDLAARAARSALNDAGLGAADVDTIAMVRLFADAAKAWACPFGGSDNPPASVAKRIGADAGHYIYSNAGGTEPLTLLAELCRDIASGDRTVALLGGAEAIATQRLAQRRGVKLNWTESFDAPLDNRMYLKRFASPAELNSGMARPVHFYALIENAQAHALGYDTPTHRSHMGALLAPFSEVAAANPLAQFPKSLSAAEIADQSADNYELCVPYSKYMVAQDAVNQAAALVLTSVGTAKRAGIDPNQWIFVTAYAQGEENYLSVRPDPGRSAAMEAVLSSTLGQADVGSDDIDLMDLYSCFPCAVHAARRCLQLSAEEPGALTVTGGLPFFGGPGNNYSMHALAEMAVRLRGAGLGLVYANGGTMSKHAAVLLSSDPHQGAAYDWHNPAVSIEPESLAHLPAANTADSGRVITWTVLNRREKPDRGIVLGETASGERFLAASEAPEITAAMRAADPIGRKVLVTTQDTRWGFSFQ